MANRSEWATNPRWDDAARADFDARVRRCRKGESRAWHFKVKARYLWLGGGDQPPRPGAAIELLERAIAESCGDGGVTGDLLEERALFQLAAGERAAGVALLQQAIDARAPNPRWQGGLAPTVLARCLVDAGDFAGAIRLFDSSLYARRDPPFRYDALEARDVLDSLGAVLTDPDAAAEYVVAGHHAAEPDEPAVPEVNASDRTSIAALDRHFAMGEPKFREPLRRPFLPRTAYTNEYLEQSFVPCYGAYLGRVLVNTAGAKWIARKPLMKSRVKLGTRDVNPFRAAFATAFYEIPLAIALEQIESDHPRFALP
ncbi:MAG TPA: hypothetical protein VN903_35880 [Polyangia bacterium]|nr:hypothetical protein [Polyangia bacterium]